jgi:parallel beta-helix repeat protein
MNRLHVMLNNRKRFLFSAALAGVLVLLAGGANALANTVWCVPNTSISSACTSGHGHIHIQSAVYAASEGDVILVGPGTYHETVYVDKENISIFGAQAGKDARTRSGWSKESIVDASPGAYGDGGGAGFYLYEAYTGVIDGFTIQGGTTGDAASGIYAYYANPQILNNIIKNNAVGIYLYEDWTALIEHNLIETNNQPTLGSEDYYIPGPGFGIAGYYDYYETTITENAFQGNLAAAIFFYYAYYYGLEINRNTSKDDGSFLVCSYCVSLSFDHNQGKDFGAKGFLPITGTRNADAAIDLVYYNAYIQINDNDLEGGKARNYSGIAFSNMTWYDSTTPYTPDGVCEYCQVSNNAIRYFEGNGIVAEPYGSESTLYYSMISHNDVENNGKDGILIGNAPENYYNTVFDNKVEGNGMNDCEDDTVNDFTAGTYNTWFNNIGSLSSPGGLCTQGGWWQ